MPGGQQARWQLCRLMNAYPFVFALFTGDDADARPGNPKGCGQVSNQLGIGLAVYRCRAEPEFDFIADHFSQSGLTGTRLDAYVQDQVVMVPAIEHLVSQHLKQVDHEALGKHQRNQRHQRRQVDATDRFDQLLERAQYRRRDAAQ